MNKNEYNATFSYKENNCNYTIFNSEYLICCGRTDIINCERRDMKLKLLNMFNIKLPGRITNLTVEKIKGKGVKLIYNNKSSIHEHIYEYHIFPPKCKDINITLIAFHSYSLYIDNLFERKTNTNYYITLNHLPFNCGNLYINENMVQNDRKKIKLGNINNTLYFISDKNEETKNYKIKYKISNSENYSDSCSIFLTILPCYHSCSNCSLIKENSDFNNHNCIECKEGYFPFPKGSSNCFSEDEMKKKNISYFFDNIKNYFSQCHSECKTCNGINEYNCLSCKNETLFLYKGRCLIECPKGTFISNNECKDCNKNCETCSKQSDIFSMNCLTCSGDKIINEDNCLEHLKSCLLIHDNKTKTFYFSYKSSNIISSCKQLYGKYIIENTNECIDIIPNGFYIVNATNGLLSHNINNNIKYFKSRKELPIKENYYSCKHNQYYDTVLNK